VIHDLRVGVRLGVLDGERVFDATGEFVDRLGVGGDGFEAALLAPAGDVGDGLAGDVEAESAQHHQRRGFMTRVERFALCPRAGSYGLAGDSFVGVSPTWARVHGDAAVEPEAKARRAELEDRRRARRRWTPSLVRGKRRHRPMHCSRPSSPTSAAVPERLSKPETETAAAEVLAWGWCNKSGGPIARGVSEHSLAVCTLWLSPGRSNGCRAGYSVSTRATRT
jgi:hypothetical protein